MPSRLNILTYNAGLLRVRLFGATLNEPVPFVNERLKHIPAVLRETNAHIVALQEVYEKAHREYIARELRSRFTYAAWIQDHSLVRVSNGLMVLSEFPIDDAAFERFRAVPLGEGLLANKGALSCRIHLPSGTIRFFNAHAVSGDIFGRSDVLQHDRTRDKQFSQLLRSLHQHNGIPTIAAGDFNAGLETSPANYESLLSAGLIDTHAMAKVRRGPDVTWHPENALNANSSSKHNPPQRIDHLFLTRSSEKHFHIETAHVVFDDEVVNTGPGQLVTPSDHHGLLVHLYQG